MQKWPAQKETIHTFTLTVIVEPQLELFWILFVGQNVSQMPRTQFWAYQIRICSILFRVKHRLASSCEEPQLSDLVSTPWRPHHGVQILASVESSRNTRHRECFLVKDDTQLCCWISSGTETRDVLLDLSKKTIPEHAFFSHSMADACDPDVADDFGQWPFPFDIDPLLKQGKSIVWRSRLLPTHVPLL